MTSRRQQRDQKPDSFDAAALEHELHAGQHPTRQDRRAVERTAARAEAEGFARVVNRRYRGEISA